MCQHAIYGCHCLIAINPNIKTCNRIILHFFGIGGKIYVNNIQKRGYRGKRFGSEEKENLQDEENTNGEKSRFVSLLMSFFDGSSVPFKALASYSVL
jgi:hypothetical protein